VKLGQDVFSLLRPEITSWLQDGPTTVRKIARATGARVETVSLVLTRMQDEGLVISDRTTVPTTWGLNTKEKDMPETKTKDVGSAELKKLLRKAGKEGMTASDVAQALEVNATTARRQLAALVAAGDAHQERKGNSTRWFLGKAGGASGTPSTKQKDATAQGSRTLAAERDAEVLAAIGKAGKDGHSKVTLAEALKTTPALAYTSIWRLAKASKIVKIRVGDRTPRYVTPDNQPKGD
jgi:DNA-binding transcriptional ArsR family regulator